MVAIRSNCAGPSTLVLSELLRDEGYEVFTAENGAKGVEAIQNTDLDLVITDMAMPHMSGAVLANKIRLIRPDIPVVICTGFSAMIDAEQARDLGIAALIMKPFDKRTVARNIRKIFDGDQENAS